MATWLCQGCGHRNEKVWAKCRGEGCKRSRPKKRVAPHAATLRDDPFTVYLELNRAIHGRDRECGVCGKPPKDLRNMDRDHGHDRTENSYGKPRGLACPGDWGCNKVMSRVSLERARLIVGYLERVEAYYAAEDYPV